MEQQKGVLVADLSGYTALTEAHGARTAADLVKRFVELVNQSLTGESRFVERVGDEVLIVAENVDYLLKTALRLQVLTQTESNFLAMHAGIHFGELLEEDGHFYGSTINQASRIASHSTGGQVLCSAAALANLHDKSFANFTSLGFVRFKNVKEPIALFEASATPTDKTGKLIDPVCRMALTANQAVDSVHHAGKTYYFCSPTCLHSFLESPQLYTN